MFNYFIEGKQTYIQAYISFVFQGT